jgi:CRISPR-associated endonuclease Cas3-HD
MAKEILAKSSGQTLDVHSKIVSDIAIIIAKKSLKNIDKTLIETIKLGGLLHDIGKCTTFFQSKIRKDIDESSIEIKQKHRHNEVGWAFLSRYLNIPKNQLFMVLDLVYWHHGISNTKQSDYYDTDVVISDTDKQTMISFAKSVLGDGFIEEKPFRPKTAPSYYFSDDDADEKNTLALFARTCIISADRIASSLPINFDENQDLEKLINETITRPCDFDLSKHPFYGNERFNKQNEIIDSIISNTTQINAPAGFGKTILGLLWNLRRGKKLIWVCPRNIVAESVYKSIREELDAFGFNFLTTELYLGSEVKQSNHLSDDFSSDIIVTNIDNYLSPSVDNRHASRLHLILNADVVFDEFHELIGESALFGCFITLMMTRHRLTDSKTLLLSATATQMYKIWDSYANKTLILPSKHSHYPAAHNKKYLLKTTDELNFIGKNNHLLILNSISISQLNKRAQGINLLLHSKFEPKHREANIQKLYDLYSKKSERNIKKESAIGTHIVQASLDVSFKDLTESVLSPQSTLQRIGRCDRWGDYEGQSVINLVNLANNSEVSMKRILYSSNLSNMWFEFISNYNGSELTLDELYKIYNDFEEKNSSVLDSFLMRKYTESLTNLSRIFPVKFYNKSKSDVKTAGSNKLRTTNSEVFVICKYHDSNKFTEPFAVAIRSNFTEEFYESQSTLKNILNTMKMLRDSNDERYDYNEILNNKKYITLDGIRIHAKKSNTPYIRFDKVYHPDYGEISQEFLTQITK